MRAITLSMSPHVSPRQGPKPKLYAATAGGIKIVKTANLRQRRRKDNADDPSP
jgi:hypothetical protein